MIFLSPDCTIVMRKREVKKSQEASQHYFSQVSSLNSITTAPRTTSTTPVARFSVFGVALLANMAAIRAHTSVNTTHSQNTVQSGAPPMAKWEMAPRSAL